jgi:uncharacterized protein (DUF885 family)
MRSVTLSILLTLLIAACSPEQPATPSVDAETPATATTPNAEWDGFVADFMEAWWKAHPIMAVAKGLHDYDGLFPDWSREGIAAEIERLKAALAVAKAFESEALDERQRFEREYLVAWVDRQLFRLDESEWPFRNVEFYFDYQSDRMNPDLYFTKPYAPLADRMAAYTLYAENLPTAVSQIRDNLRTPMPRTYAEHGLSIFRGMAEFTRDEIPGIYAEVDDADLQARFASANTMAAEALAGTAAFFESALEDANEDYAMGPELYARMLTATIRFDISLERLEEIARTDLQRNLDALGGSCEVFAPGLDLHACMGKATAIKPEGGAVAAAREQLKVLKAFLIEESIVTIPGEEPILVNEAPPYARTNFAYINVAGPFSHNMPSTYYIAPPDAAWPQAVQDAYVPGRMTLQSTSVHEVWPGHFLQFQHSNRAASPIGQAYVSYNFAEGWAHYAEEMMLEAGLGRGDPEVKIGQLRDALLRNVRFLCSIGLHTQGMSVEECRKLFMEKGFQDPGNALQQAYRGTYDPGYFNYTLGKLMIRKLRDEWSADRGGQDAWGEFHDAFLSRGGPPVPLVRQQMLGEDAGPPL